MAPLKGELSPALALVTEGFTPPPQFANWGTSPFRGGVML